MKTRLDHVLALYFGNVFSLCAAVRRLGFLESKHKMLYVYKTNNPSVGNRPGAVVKWGEGVIAILRGRNSK